MGNDWIPYSLSKEEILMWRHFLSHFSLDYINQQIQTYKSCCLHYATNEHRIAKAVESLFEIKYQGHSFPPNFKYSIIPEKRPQNFPYYFFRIRPLEKQVRFETLNNNSSINFETLEFEDIQTFQDVWEPPADKVTKYGRLHKPHTPVLYTSLEPSAAVKETIIQNHDPDKVQFIMIVYKSVGDFCYSDCSNFLYFKDLTEEENMKRYILFNFLRDEFTRTLPKPYNERDQYCAAYHISKKFFIAEESQAIQYPSARGLGQRNFAFWGNIRECLDFVGFRCCYITETNGRTSNISILADCFWDEESGHFRYYSPYSEESKQVFGEPLLSMMLQK
jgi:hypothetical protein